MGYNSENARLVPFYLDCETVGNPAAVSQLPEVKPNGNLVDPAKIAANIAEKLAKRSTEAALDIDTAQIVAIAFQYDTQPVEVYSADRTDEAGMLENIWGEIAMHQRLFPTSPLVGFNLLAYDLPLLVRRSQLLNVPMGGVTLRLNRYRHDGILDLMQVMTFDGLLDFDKRKGLSTYCRLFGIDVPDLNAGSDIAALVASGDWQAVREHCRADVLKTKALAERVGAVR